MKEYLVVFDGSTAYLIPSCDLEQEKAENCVEVLGQFDDIDEADEFVDESNSTIMDKYHN
jgi:hypothetical protein